MHATSHHIKEFKTSKILKEEELKLSTGVLNSN
jgi:hypothetical protein